MCAAGGDLLGQHGPVCPAAERRRALRHRCDAAAGAGERDLRRAVSAAVRPAEAAAPPARYLVLRGQWDLQPDAVFLVLFYGDAGCEPRGHGCASLYRAGVRHADEHRVLPGKADGGEADGAGFVPGGLRAGVGRGLVGAARAAGAVQPPAPVAGSGRASGTRCIRSSAAVRSTAATARGRSRSTPSSSARSAARR